MVTLGIDAHKRSHTVVAVDDVGRKLGELTVAANEQGLIRLLDWARTRYGQPRWAVEDCRPVTVGLERALLSAGVAVTRVPPHLTVTHRRAARTRGKSDPIDALAIARAVLANPDLPTARLDNDLHDLQLLLAHRTHLVAERTRMINRLRWALHALNPDLAPRGSLYQPANLRKITGWLATQPVTVATTLAGELAATIAAATDRITSLERDITRHVTPRAHRLLTLPGCGPLTAAKILTETADITRFATTDKYAAYAGTAPIPASSGNTTRHRLSRGGNRNLNTALHMIAITQIRLHGPGRDYYQRLKATGKTSKEALRCLKRKLTKVVYQLQHPSP